MILPSLPSLRRWLKKLDLEPGINNKLFECIKSRAKSMNEFEKDTILMIDEMSIKSLIMYDKNRDELEGIVDHGNNRRNLGTASEALVALIQGINTRWVFP